MLPISVTADFGKVIGYLIYFLIGAGFGATLELAGFGDSRKLASQFYFKDMTVLKTMFTGIITACVLIFLSSAIGLLDFSQIVVNETYLWPGIVGGLIMGVGFIVGGYCPGTSIVAAASLKKDGMAFVLGTLIGVGLFGESVSCFYDFWHSSYFDRFLLSDWLGWSIGGTVTAVVLLALVMFYGAEKSEEFFRIKRTGERFSWRISNRNYWVGAATFLFVALLTWGLGQPDPARKWDIVRSRYEQLLISRDVFVSPLEYVKTWNDNSIKLITLDLRSKEDFEKFHLDGAKKVELNDFRNPELVSELTSLPTQGVVILVSDEEQNAVQAWQWLKAQGVVNLYILENGIRNWQATFAGVVIPHERLDLTKPSLKVLDQFPKDAYKSKIKLKTIKRAGGLCG